MLTDPDHNESVLLMYLAGELPAGERDEVEMRLSHDATLRTQLETLRSAYASAEGTLRRFDQITRPPLPDPVAVRQATRLIRQWQDRRSDEARRQWVQANAVERTLRFAWWAYPLATAAAIALALLVWWTNLDNLNESSAPYVDMGTGGWNGWRPGGGAFMNPGIGPIEPLVGEEPVPTEELWADTLERSFDRSEELFDEALAGDALDQAESELLAMWDRRSDFPDALFLQEPSPPEEERP